MCYIPVFLLDGSLLLLQKQTVSRIVNIYIISRDRLLVATGRRSIIEILYVCIHHNIQNRTITKRFRLSNTETSYLCYSSYETPFAKRGSPPIGPGKISEQPLENQNKVFAGAISYIARYRYSTHNGNKKNIVRYMCTSDYT